MEVYIKHVAMLKPVVDSKLLGKHRKK